MKINWPKLDFQHSYIWFVTIMAFSYLFAVTFYPISEVQQRFADIITGAMIGSVLSTVIDYVFGSSKRPTPPNTTVETTTETVTKTDTK